MEVNLSVYMQYLTWNLGRELADGLLIGIIIQLAVADLQKCELCRMLRSKYGGFFGSDEYRMGLELTKSFPHKHF